jgi:protein-S-isoprenylcysteine O-methyltransferase Ste14
MGLNRSGLRYIVREVGLSVLVLIILFITAGTIFWINAWVLFGLIIGYQTTNFIILYTFNPEILNERGKIVQQNTKQFDKAFVVIFLILGFIIPIVAALDAIRFRWSYMPFGVSILGIILMLCSFCLGIWAMAVNTGFEMTVRIQDDRGHRVCTTGPYKFIRHPGYAAEIIAAPAYSLVLGSWWALIPVAAFIALFIVRTALEDRTLQEELPGYKEYAGKTRYRLIPYIW